MVFPIHINIVDLVFKGMLIGMIASAPMGPVGILCVQRTLNKGRGYGFATGLGAAVSDIIYAGITGFGMAFVMDFVNNDQNKFYLQIIGSAGFSKSLAILAQSLLRPIPIFTVNPSSSRILFLIVCASATGSGYMCPVPVISIKHSSMENSSTTGA